MYANTSTVKTVGNHSRAGTDEERGMAKWREHLRGKRKQKDDEGEADGEAVHKPISPSSDCYDLPCGMSFIRRWAFFKFVPFCPTFLVDIKQAQTTNDDDVEGAGVTV